MYRAFITLLKGNFFLRKTAKLGFMVQYTGMCIADIRPIGLAQVKELIGEYFIAVKEKHRMLTPGDIEGYSKAMFEQIY